MKHLLLLLLALCSLSLALPQDCEAARMGGGRSFGSQPTMRTPTVAPRPMQQQRPMAAPAQAAPRPSTGMGAMGGLFGGLLAGTLLGSLLGGGHAGVAGGGGIGFIDIILFGLLIWLGFKIFRKMRSGQEQPAAYEQSSYTDVNTQYQNSYQYQNQGGAWDQLRNAAGTQGFGAQIPADFNVEEFLQGAKAAYVRMQSSWDQRDLDDIALFATPAVLDVLREQQAQDPNPSRTELLNINQQLMNVTDDGLNQRAQVYFEVLMREDPNQRQPETVREIWHFVRTLPDGTWKLDGIQQAH